MERYKHLSQIEREKIAVLKSEGMGVRFIAQQIGKSASTVCREIRRNESLRGQYWPERAQRLYLLRRHRGSILDKDLDLQVFVLEKLQCHWWSPEQIAGYLKTQQDELAYICHETIYAWIYGPSCKKDKLWKYLRYHKGKRGKRSCRTAGISRIPERVSIHERPANIAGRKEFGHWEADLVAFRKNSQNILVAQERKSRFIMGQRLTRKLSQEVCSKLKDTLTPLPKEALKTMTMDNGGEFALHTYLKKEFNMKTYFCDPYASWQKGGIENANGRLCIDLPRKTKVKEMREEDFDEVIQNYNTTPRKCLGWYSPLQVFNENLQRVALHT